MVRNEFDFVTNHGSLLLYDTLYSIDILLRNKLSPKKI